jgi:hypothetical protein
VELVSSDLHLRAISDLIHKVVVRLIATTSTITGVLVAPNKVLACFDGVENIDRLKVCDGDRECKPIASYLDNDIGVTILTVDLPLAEKFEHALDFDKDDRPGDRFCICSYDRVNSPLACSKVNTSLQCQEVSYQEDINGNRTIIPLEGSIDTDAIGASIVNLRTQKVCGILKSLRPAISANGLTFIGGDVLFFDRSLRKRIYSMPDRSTFGEYKERVPYLIPNNKFIGRTLEIKKILEFLSSENGNNVLIVDGVAGIGKTALILEIARLCNGEMSDEFPVHQFDEFDRVIIISYENRTSFYRHFTSADTILPDADILLAIDTIANGLGLPDLKKVYQPKDFGKVYNALEQQSTLLIVDGLEETLSQRSIRVMDFFRNIPLSTKVLITTRRFPSFYSQIPLKPLHKKEARLLIEDEANQKGIHISGRDISQLYDRFNGVPIALVYAVGQYAAGYKPSHILQDISTENNKGQIDVGQICFNRSLRPLQGKIAYDLLLSLSLFRQPPCYSALVRVAGIEDKKFVSAAKEAIQKLIKLSLIIEEKEYKGEEYQSLRYRMLPTTREYTLSELAVLSDIEYKFEMNIRSRWIDWYREFSQNNLQEMTEVELDLELDNIGEVLSWCADRDDYKSVKEIWDNVNRFIEKKEKEENKYLMLRFHWWEYLEKESKKRADIVTYVKALSEKANTWMEMDDIEHRDEVISSLQEATKFQRYAPQDVQSKIKDYLEMYHKKVVDRPSPASSPSIDSPKPSLPKKSAAWNNGREAGEVGSY